MELNIDTLMQYIQSELLVLILVLYVLGMFMKSANFIPDKFIPAILLVISIAFAIALLGFTVDAIIQGILIAGAAVFFNQLVKQSSKSK